MTNSRMFTGAESFSDCRKYAKPISAEAFTFLLLPETKQSLKNNSIGESC